MDEIIGMLEARVIVVLIPALVCLPIVILFLNMFVMPFKKNKALSKAWADGHVVDAKLIDKSDYIPSASDDRSEDKWSDLKYEYYYNNKRYVYKVRTNYTSMPKYERKLYFKQNPAKAKMETSFGGVENKWKVYWGLVLIFFIISFAIV